MVALHRFFKKAHTNNLPVPAPLIHNTVFTPQIDCRVFFSSRQAYKRNLCNAIFDLRRLEHGGIQLAFGIQTDGFIIGVLFEKTVVDFVPQN